MLHTSSLCTRGRVPLVTPGASLRTRPRGCRRPVTWGDPPSSPPPPPQPLSLSAGVSGTDQRGPAAAGLRCGEPATEDGEAAAAEGAAPVRPVLGAGGAGGGAAAAATDGSCGASDPAVRGGNGAAAADSTGREARPGAGVDDRHAAGGGSGGGCAEQRQRQAQAGRKRRLRAAAEVGREADAGRVAISQDKRMEGDGAAADEGGAKRARRDGPGATPWAGPEASPAAAGTDKTHGTEGGASTRGRGVCAADPVGDEAGDVTGDVTGDEGEETGGCVKEAGAAAGFGAHGGVCRSEGAAGQGKEAEGVGQDEGEKEEGDNTGAEETALWGDDEWIVPAVNATAYWAAAVDAARRDPWKVREGRREGLAPGGGGVGMICRERGGREGGGVWLPARGAAARLGAWMSREVTGSRRRVRVCA